MLFLLVICLSLAACKINSPSYTTFVIEGFDAFFSFNSSDEYRKNCIIDGKIEFAKLSNIYVCPFIKEINHDECGLFFYIYSHGNKIAESVTINNIDLVIKNNGESIFCNNAGYSVSLENTNDNLVSGTVRCVFETSEEWLYHGCVLNLSFHAETDDNAKESKEFSYEITIRT